MSNALNYGYHKIFRAGNSRALIVTRHIPEDWKLVRVTRQGNSDNAVVLRIERVA